MKGSGEIKTIGVRQTGTRFRKRPCRWIRSSPAQWLAVVATAGIERGARWTRQGSGLCRRQAIIGELSTSRTGGN